MKVRAQIAMVLNLDKCIGCHTCSITCKNVWTNREGVEYAWFNNVETKPGIGYPKDWENQKRWKGGWIRKKNGSFQPRPIKIGQAQGNNWVVLEGLQAGEKVIVEGFTRLRPGVTKVTPVPAGAKPAAARPAAPAAATSAVPAPTTAASATASAAAAQ